MESFKKAFKVAEKIRDEIWSNFKKYTEKSNSAAGFQFNEKLINEIIDNESKNNNIQRELIDKCLVLEKGGTLSDYEKVMTVTKDPYSGKDLWSDPGSPLKS